MAETVKKGDFIEIEYTGKLKDLNLVFDTTNKEIAKKAGIPDETAEYGPVLICVGQGQILVGLDNALEGKEINKEHVIELSPENAFGQKDAKLIQLVQTSVFKKEGIAPVPGFQVNIDGALGVIRTVSGGRTLVDFNHPFSGKAVVYAVNIKRFITDTKEKILSLLYLALNQKKEAIIIKIENNSALIVLKQDFPEEQLATLKERIIKLVPNISSVMFNVPKTEKKEVVKKES